MLHYFDRSQMLFIEMDDLRKAHSDTLRKIYRFLDVKNQNWIAEQRFLRVGNNENIASKRTIKKLRQKFRQEITRLERLLGWNLDKWKQAPRT
jgi:hypothetical protein